MERHTRPLGKSKRGGRKAHDCTLESGILFPLPSSLSGSPLFCVFTHSSDAQLMTVPSQHTRPQTTEVSPQQGPESAAMRERSSRSLLRVSIGHHWLHHEKSVFPQKNRGAVGRGISRALCVRRKAEDRWTLDTLASSHIHTHTGHPAGAQRTKQPNPISEPKRKLPAVWQAACVRTGRPSYYNFTGC